MYNLDGKVALVTAGGAWLGRAIALRLAQEGATLVLNDVVAKRLDSPDGLVYRIWRVKSKRWVAGPCSVVADVSNARQVEAMVQQGLAKVWPD